MRTTALPALSLLLIIGMPPAATADPLIGDVGATLNRADAAIDNPANAGFMERSEFVYTGELYQQETFSARYPGLPPSQIATDGVSAPFNQPSLIFKPSKNFGIGGFALPPLPTTVNLHWNALPLVLLGSEVFVDAKIAAHLNGLGSAVGGYRINDQVGFGLGINYLSAKFNMNLAPTGQPEQSLAKVSGTLTRAQVVLGGRVDLMGGRFSLGLAVAALSQQEVRLSVTSPLLSGANSAVSGDPGLTFKQVFSGGLVGFRTSLLAHAVIMGELRYARADPAQQSLSLVTLRNEPADVHDTVAVRAGGIVHIGEGLNFLLGARYEPTMTGPGSRGATPMAGFGTIDAVQVVVGFTPLTPYYLIASGLQFGFMPSQANATALKPGHPSPTTVSWSKAVSPLPRLL